VEIYPAGPVELKGEDAPGRERQSGTAGNGRRTRSFRLTPAKGTARKADNGGGEHAATHERNHQTTFSELETKGERRGGKGGGAIMAPERLVPIWRGRN